MKIPLVKLAAIVAFIGFTAISSFAQYPDTVKIMTYNINWETNKNGQYDSIVKVIKAIDATIVGLQKLDSCMGTSNPCNVAQLLGEKTSMSYTFVTGEAKYNGSNGSYGNGFLSDQAPKSVRRLSIPKGSASVQRGALEIGVTLGGEAVRVIVTHLDYSNATVRSSEMQQILSWIDSGGAKTIPVVIMADFNAQPTEDCMKQLTNANFAFVKTSTGVILDTTQKINHILYRPENRWTVIDASNPHYSASNRNPLWALMSLNNPVSVLGKSPEKLQSFFQPEISINKQDVKINLPRRSETSLMLYATSGRKIRTIENSKMLEAGNYSYSIQRQGLAKGLYFLEALVDGKSTTGKIFLAR